MIGLSSSVEFKRALIEKAMGKVGREAVEHFAARTALIARRSMRRRKKGHSKPGQPPFAKKGTIRDLIRFDWDGRNAMVIGPQLFAPKNGAPNTLEFGGTVAQTRRRIRKVGDGGEVRTSGGRVGGPGRGAGGRFRSRGRTTREIVDSRGVKVWVTFAKLRTPAMVARANAINADLFRPKESRIAARPFMAPALKIGISSKKPIEDAAKRVWKSSVRAG